MIQDYNSPILGFIGFGEAAFHIGCGLHGERVSQILAFDIMAADTSLGALIRQRAETAHVTLMPSLRDLLGAADIVFCATSAKYALSIAGEAKEYLREGQLYADLNSASPRVKQEIAEIIGPTGAFFVDTAVMELVPPHRHKVPMAVSGSGAKQFMELLSRYGMNITYINERAGSSSTIKMLRSIFMKGLTSLLLETLTASRKAGLEAEIMASISQTVTEQPFETLVNLLLTRTSVAAERRVAEMGEVIGTLEELGLDSTASRATQTKLQALANLDLRTRFGQKPPEHYTQVLDAVIECSGTKET